MEKEAVFTVRDCEQRPEERPQEAKSPVKTTLTGEFVLIPRP